MDLEAQDDRDAVLEAALDVAADEVEEFLQERCKDNVELQQEVRRLLAVRARMKTDFLESSAIRWTLPVFVSGDRLGRYEIEDVISPGGMSVVYRARDTGIGRMVAIKVLMPGGAPARADAQFETEVRILGGIRHPNVVQIFDFGTLRGMPYLVMEYLEGEDLAGALSLGLCGDFNWKLQVARQLATALCHVHRSGIIHRDIKPANVFVEPSGSVKLMDFGISRFDNTGATATTNLIGTPEYLSPEHVKGERATHRSDIYSYGVLLFELFAERKAFLGNTAELLYQIVHKDIPLDLLRTRGVPKQLAALIRATTCKNPLERPASFEEVLAWLECSSEEKDGRRPPLFGSPWVKAMAGVVMLGIAGVATLRLSQTTETQPIAAPTHAAQPHSESAKNFPVETKPIVVEARTPTKPDRITAAPAKEMRNSAAPTSATTPRTSHLTRPRASEIIATPPRPQQASDPLLSGQLPPSHLPPLTIQTPALREPAPSKAGGGQTSADAATTVPAANLSSAVEIDVKSQKTRVADANAAKLDVLDALRRYEAAYKAKDISKISAIFPSMNGTDHLKLVSAFSVAKNIDLQLSPQEDPQLEPGADGLPALAVVHCTRRIQMIPVSGRAPKPQSDNCVIRLERIRGSWLIQSQRSF